MKNAKLIFELLGTSELPTQERFDLLADLKLYMAAIDMQEKIKFFQKEVEKVLVETAQFQLCFFYDSEDSMVRFDITEAEDDLYCMIEGIFDNNKFLNTLLNVSKPKDYYLTFNTQTLPIICNQLMPEKLKTAFDAVELYEKHQLEKNINQAIKPIKNHKI